MAEASQTRSGTTAAAPAELPLPTFGPAARNSIVALLTAQVLGLFSALVLPRYLGASEYGRVGLALTFSVYAYQLVQWGIDPYLAALLARAGPDAARQHIAACLRMKVCAAIVVLLLGAAFVSFTQLPHNQMLILAGVIHGALLAFSMAGAFDARHRTALFFVFFAIRQAIFLGSVLLLANLRTESLTAMNVLLLYAASVIPQVVLEWIWIGKTYGPPVWSGAGPAAAGMWRAAIPLGISAAAWHLSWTLGPPLLFAFSGSMELGVLYLSNQIATVLYSFTTIPVRMLNVRLAVKAESPDFKSIVWRRMIVFALIGAAAAAACSVLAPWIVPRLFGEEYSPSARLLALDAWRIVGTMAGGVASAALICRNRRRDIAICEVLALLVAASVAVLFVGTYGAHAMVAAVLAGRAMFAVFASVAVATNKDAGIVPDIGERSAGDPV